MSKKQISRRQKLLAGICIPLATAGVAGGVAAILLTRNKPVTPTVGDYKVTFCTDENARFVNNDYVKQNVYAGDTLDRINKPTVQSYKANYMFAGWADERSNAVPGKYKFTRDTKLTALFGDTTTGDYYTITFKKKPEESKVELHGNVSVAVKKGYYFMMVNRPTAEWSNNYFQCWQYKDADGNYVDIDEETEITEDLVLYPRFTQAVTMTWDENTKEGGYIVRGQSTTTLAAGTKFDNFNQPQLANTNVGWTFSGWKREDGTSWLATDIVDEDSKAIATWIEGSKPTEGYHMISFVQNDQTGAKVEVTFAPSASVVVQTQTPQTWAQTTKPTVRTDDNNYEVESWEYSEQTDQGWTDWATLEDSHAFSISGGSTKIRPVMKSSISGVTISGKDTVLPESTNKYVGVVEGTSENPNPGSKVSWSLWLDEKCTKEAPKSTASIDVNGNLTVTSLTNSVDLYLKGTAVADKTTFEVKHIFVEMPYVESQRIWYHNGTQWFSISQKDGLCDGTAKTMQSTALNSKTGEASQTITKSEIFNYKLFVGRQLTELYKEFGYNWYGFDAEIDFGENLKTIKSSFLENCYNFNQPLDLTYVTTIGDNFLCGCGSFGAPSSIEGHEYDSLITFGTGLRNIGDNFLMHCDSYNRKLELPNVALNIGRGFLFNCYNFNQNIVIPANINKILDFFMFNCDNFTSKITVNCNPANVFVENIYTIASKSSGAEIYNTGFTVDPEGTYASEFATMFPTYNANHSYRRVLTEATKGITVTQTEFETAVAKIKPDSTQGYANVNYSIESDMTGELWFTSDANGVLTAYAPDVKGDHETAFQKSVGNYTTSAANNFIWKNFGANGRMIALGWDKENSYTANTDSFFGGFVNTYLTGMLAYNQWTYNETKGKYVSGENAYPLYMSGKTVNSTVELEFKKFNNVPYISMMTVTPENKKDPFTITFSDYDTTKLPKTQYGLEDSNFTLMSGSVDNGLVSSSAFTYNALSGQQFITVAMKMPATGTLTNKLDISISLDEQTPSTYAKYGLSEGTWSPILVDSNGYKKDGTITLEADENGTNCRIVFTQSGTSTLQNGDMIVLAFALSGIQIVDHSYASVKATFVSE